MTLAELRESRASLAATALAAADAAQAAEGTDDAQARHESFLEAERSVREHDERIARSEALTRAREQYTPLPAEPVVATEERARQGGLAPVVTHEAASYHPGDEGQGFFSDLYHAMKGDTAARARLERNNLWTHDELKRRITSQPDTRKRFEDEKQMRAVGQAATGIGEFIPPLWLNDQYAPYLRAGRAFADQCFSHPLPMGTNNINVPKITTGSTTAVQTDGGAVSNTDLVTTSVTAQYQTIAGRTIASRQLYDLGVPSMDGVIFADLLADYMRRLDTAVLNGTVTNAKGVLQVGSTNTVAYTDSSPTGPELWPTIFQGKSAIEKGAYCPVDFVAMHPSTWNWFISSLDSNNRPLALDTTGAVFNAFAAWNPNAQGLVGNLAGIPVIGDANIPVNTGSGTNQAPIVMCNRQTLYLYENAPVMQVADQVSIANLQLQFVMWGYYAVAFGRQPAMISVVNGTGLIVQSGY